MEGAEREAARLTQGPWPVNSRLAALRKKRSHPQLGLAPKGAGPGESAALAGDCQCGSAGFGRIAVVLVERIDCRSRQTVCGPSRPASEEFAVYDVGSSSPSELEERKSIGSRVAGGKTSRPVAGPKTTGGAKALRWDILSMEGALSRESCSF